MGEDHSDVAVRGVLCFTRAELPLLRTLTIARTCCCTPRHSPSASNQEGPLSQDVIEKIGRKLAATLPPA